MVGRAWLVGLCLLLGASAEDSHVYVGDLGPRHVLLAWGTTNGSNTIGRSSRPAAPAEVRIDGRTLKPKDNYLNVTELQPDTEYGYEVLVGGKSWGKGKIRTWAEKADQLCFFVIGDWGKGDSGQARVAEAMVREQDRLAGSCPVRFVLSTGDNIYSPYVPPLQFYVKTGASDRDWRSRFFVPYRNVISRIPFYAVLGNHDGNESEARADLPAHLDNFFFPLDEPARWFRFQYADLAEFFALDSTRNTESGLPAPAFTEHGPQHQWFELVLEASRAPWKIVYIHHPIFTAGPSHDAERDDLLHFVKLFESNGVRVVFSGHEHNLQISEASKETGGIRYIVSGAGGELRKGDVRSDMVKAHVAAWAPQRHFLSVQIRGREMRVLPLSSEPVVVQNPEGKPVAMPLEISLPALLK